MGPDFTPPPCLQGPCLCPLPMIGSQKLGEWDSPPITAELLPRYPSPCPSWPGPEPRSRPRMPFAVPQLCCHSDEE